MRRNNVGSTNDILPSPEKKRKFDAPTMEMSDLSFSVSIPDKESKRDVEFVPKETLTSVLNERGMMRLEEMKKRVEELAVLQKESEETYKKQIEMLERHTTELKKANEALRGRVSELTSEIRERINKSGRAEYSKYEADNEESTTMNGDLREVIVRRNSGQQKPDSKEELNGDENTNILEVYKFVTGMEIHPILDEEGKETRQYDFIIRNPNNDCALHFSLEFGDTMVRYIAKESENIKYLPNPYDESFDADIHNVVEIINQLTSLIMLKQGDEQQPTEDKSSSGYN